MAPKQIIKETKVPPPSVQFSEDHTEDTVDPLAHLPPIIITNPRLKIEPEFVPQEKMVKRKEIKVQKLTARMWTDQTKQKDPIPKHPISLSWWPNELCFKLGPSAAVTKLIRIMNRSPKIMYIHCCGLCNDMARMGASWKCHPRIRFLLAPGLSAEMFITAKPREESPVPCAYAGLQLATAHRKDTVFGFFVVPIKVIFYNYVPPEQMECEGEIDE